MPEGESESYEIIPVTPLKRLEQRLEKVEQSGTVPQLQSLINQIIELIRSNQKIVNDVIQANSELRNEISKLPPKMEDLTNIMKNFISMVEAAGKEEVGPPSTIGTPSVVAPPSTEMVKPITEEMLKPLTEYLQKMVDQNDKLLENNQAMIDQLDGISKKLKAGTPVSQILSSYPSLKYKGEVSK